MKSIFYIFTIVFILLVSQSSAGADINSGLVAHWSFDNDDGTSIVDAAAGKLNGTAYNISYEQGPVGNAVKFDSQQDAIYFPSKEDIPPLSISNLSVGSISVWFKYQSVGGQMLPIFYYGESQSGTPHNSLIIEIGHGDNAANRRLYFTIVGQRYCYDSGKNLEENKWYHFVAIISSHENTGYLNGEEMTGRHYNLGSDDTFTDFFSDVPVSEMLSLGYGRYGLSDRFYTFKGSIDEVRIYDRALSPADVAELYAQGETTDLSIPTFENISYGDDPRNVLDFWQAESETPTPVVVFIHGGGFSSGSKENARTAGNLRLVERCLENGVSFAAINYRYRQTTRLDTIMLDCARAFQFIRSKSNEWNVDKTKFASFGGSAGGGATIWLAFKDDLADPDNQDPVLRESTRLTVCGHLNSQATYDFDQWAEILKVDESWMSDMNTREDLELYHISDRDQYDDPEIVELRAFLDMPAFLDAEDPPIFFQNPNSENEPTSAGAIIHHPRHAIYLKKLADELGIDNEIDLASIPYPEKPDMLDFFFKYLLGNTSVNEIDTHPKSISLFPNPASEYVIIKGNEFSRPQTISIYNSIGEKMIKTVFEPSSSPHRVNISALTNGVYTIVIQSEDIIMSEKFVVIK